MNMYTSLSYNYGKVFLKHYKRNIYKMYVRFDDTLQCLNIHLSILQQSASKVIEHLYNIISNNKLK